MQQHIAYMFSSVRLYVLYVPCVDLR